MNISTRNFHLLKAKCGQYFISISSFMSLYGEMSSGQKKQRWIVFLPPCSDGVYKLTVNCMEDTSCPQLH